MIIAEQKLKENIAEYLIYMYQVEDLIRANEFDAARIELSIINKFDVSYEVKREMLEWYKALIEGLIKEKKQKAGHLEFLILITDELNFMNAEMLNTPLKKDVKDAYKKASPNIEALRMKSGHSNETDVQLAMNGLYGYLILRLQKKEISKETAEAFSTITEWIALLSAEYMMKK
ncbi:MAG: DUF4924 family protein [Bacteroidales bacterium]|jgi:inorganic pyrophosphatase/exopolyphosphatase|nr:DUF4924 family protein [Bacteroidales bacterium]